MSVQFNKLSMCIVFSLAFMLSRNTLADTANYVLVDTLHLPGATRWDYLTFDSPTHRLFITRGESVDVLDVESKKIVGSIPNTNGVHGVTLALDLDKGFTSNGKANTVTIFDLRSLKEISTPSTGSKPDAIVYDASTKRVFIANGESDDMTVLDAKTGKAIDTIKLGGKPEFAVVDGKGQLFVNLEDKSQLAVVDTRNLKVLAHYDLAPNCSSPTGLAIDMSQRRLFSVCSNKAMVVVDGLSGKILDTLPIGAHSDAALFDPMTKLAFSSNGDGTLTVVKATTSNNYEVVQTVVTKPTARTMALDPSTHQLYLAAAETEGFETPLLNHPDPRPHIKSDTFMILTVGQKINLPNPKN